MDSVGSEDDLPRMNPNALMASPLLGRFVASTSSPPGGGGGSVVIRRGSGGPVPINAVLARTSASKPLRMSSSATHLPLVHSNSATGGKCPPVTAATAAVQYQPSISATTAAMMNREMSDTESIGSCDSMQDLVNIQGSTMTSRWHRHSSGSSAFCPIRTPLASHNSVSSVLSCSPSSICSVRTSFSTAQAIANHLQQQQANGCGGSGAAAVSVQRVARSVSSNLFEDDLMGSRVGTPVGGGGTGGTTGGASSPFGHESHQFLAKHLHSEKVVSKHSLKGRLSKYQRLLDRAFALISNIGTDESIVEGCMLAARIMITAWLTPKIGHDLAYGLCDYLRQMSYFDSLLNFFIHSDTKRHVRLAAGRALEQCLSAPNREYVASSGDDEFATLNRMVEVIKTLKDTEEEIRTANALLEGLFKHNARTNAHLIELSALDHLLSSCMTNTTAEALKHTAMALANLAIYSDVECRQQMIAKKVPEWLFFLASNRDTATRYYACLSACILVSHKEVEAAVSKSGTLSLVEQFLMAHKPADFATSDYKNIQGRPRPWLEKLVPVLSAKRRESRAMAAFHFAMEAGIKRDQERIELFHQIGAVEALKQVAALPEDVAPKFATVALEIIGAEVPHKLTPQVPLWSVEDVQYWVTHIGFEKFAFDFAEQRVDGDLLLLLGDGELEDDIGMKSGLLRRRFMRELEGLKMAADYSCVDETELDRFLVSIDPHFSVYTYQLLEIGVDRSVIESLTDEVLRSSCCIDNPIHRLKLMKAIEESKHSDDMEVALLSKHIDIFISYRRSTGNQLASLIKVLLQLRGYKVFIDVDRLYAGKFDCSLLKNIQAAKHFILVLTPAALDRCVDDDGCNDWLHKELLCALETNKNIIPVFDPQFDWPDESRLPGDVRAVTRFNGVRWVHEYQDACVDKLERFIIGELNIDRGFYPSPPRPSFNPLNYHQGISKASSISSPMEVPDSVLDALSSASRGRITSQDLNDNGPLSPRFDPS